MSKESFKPTQEGGGENIQADKDNQGGEIAVFFGTRSVLNEQSGFMQDQNEYIIVKDGKPYRREIFSHMDHTGDPKYAMSQFDSKTDIGIEHALREISKQEEEVRKRLENLNRALSDMQKAKEILSKGE